MLKNVNQNKIWRIGEADEARARKLALETGLSLLTAKVLVSRGMEEQNTVNEFLNPSLGGLHDPFLLKDMDRAVMRIVKAVENHEKIVIYGDYDVDGITGTSVLYDFLRKRGAAVDFYIPDRMDEGYGLSIRAADKIRESGAGLIVTVDCGITAFEEARHIKAGGMDIVITDHHACKEEIPEADAVVNPCRGDCAYPFKSLAGVGVAYKLVHALCIELGLGDVYNRYLALVAMGTVADVVPLVGENRTIVKFGLQALERTENLGLKTLVESSGLKDRAINSWSIGFVLAPRINVAGRIGDAGRAVKLLTTDDLREAQDIVAAFQEENKYRQETEGGIFQQVIREIENTADLEKEKIIVVSGENWHHGVIGIVASKVAERYYRPCILISCEEGVGKGSARSIEGFHLFKALHACRDILVKFGGHALAAGITIEQGNIGVLKKRINEYADTVMKASDLLPKLQVDISVGREEISLAGVKDLERLAPYGAGNPSPIFAYNGLKINDLRTVGEDKHLKLRLEDGGVLLDAIGFHMGGLSAKLKNSEICKVAFALEVNTWNSTEKVQLNIRDIKHDEEAALEDKYYYSLERCLSLDRTATGDISLPQAETCDAEPEEGLYDRLADAAGNNRRVVVMVNSLESARQLGYRLRKTSSEVKVSYKVGYMDRNGENMDGIHIVVNPDPDRIELPGLDEIIFYGIWLDDTYLSRLVERAGTAKTYFYRDKSIPDICCEAIIPERQDLAAVYRYIQANGGRLRVKDLFSFAKAIAVSYRIAMNYFKVKKSIEIFEELNLLKKEPLGEHGLLISINGDISGKTQLENSLLYRNLQQLKDRIRLQANIN